VEEGGTSCPHWGQIHVNMETPFLLYINRPRPPRTTQPISYDNGMEFLRRPAASPSSLGILPGTFNPPTRAHLALARAGLVQVDEVLFVLPRLFPHKSYEGVGFEDRLRLIVAAAEPHPRFSVAACPDGLFANIARECREAFGAGVALKFLCGRDAAARAVNWDYGRPGAFLDMLQEFELLVAARQGTFEAPPEMRSRIHTLPLPPGYDEVSATEVRARIFRGEPWQHLVPPETVPLVSNLYGK
jgi:nicotinate-nucleotide adenylyltransferase